MRPQFIVCNIVGVLLLQSGIGVAQTAPPATKSREHSAEAKAANLDVNVLHELDAAMQKQVDEGHVAGVIGLIGRHGKLGYYEAFGKRVIDENAPMTKNALFRIFSMTKPIVVVTAMSLWEEEKFKLDDPISVHLPEWKDATVREGGKVVPATTPVTPRHLMTHSSGLTYNKDGVHLEKGGTLDEFSKSLAKRPLKFQPGTDYSYGYSTDVLGRYIESIEGKTLDVVMRERVLNRLGMDDTEFWVRNPADRDRLAKVYRKSSRGGLKRTLYRSRVMSKPSRMMGGQGLISSAGDYARFCEMLLNKGQLNGTRVLKAETVNLMFENHLSKIGKEYGLGGKVDGKGGYQWGGAAGTRFWIDSRNDYYGLFMVQTWGYNAPTYRVFRRHVERAILPKGD